MPEPGTDPHVLQADHHPTPFTAAEIRDASRPGRTVRRVVEAAGEPTVTRVQRWLHVDEEGGSGLAIVQDADHETIDRQPFRSRWLDLQRHASMPMATTTIDEVVLDSPMGPLDCLRYTRLDGDAVDVFWFARSMPGMPVRTERVEGGRVTERVTMVANEVLPLSPDDLVDEHGANEAG